MRPSVLPVTGEQKPVRPVPVTFKVWNPFGSVTGAFMADKSPRQAASKKSSKSIKEKRADKRASAAPPSAVEKPAKSAGAKKK
jgi:hypothetical protein